MIPHSLVRPLVNAGDIPVFMVDLTDAYPVQLHPFSNPDKQQVHGVGDVPGFSEKLQRKGGQFFISAQIAAADTVDQQFVRVQAGQPAAHP